MPVACVRLKLRAPYHGDLMWRVLETMGYTCTENNPRPQKGDLAILWNRYQREEWIAKAHEDAGGRVIVVENGYFGRNFGGTEWYAMAVGHHNGAGRWPAADLRRWQSLGIPLEPWRDGKEIVILAARGMGSERVKEPKGWPQAIAAKLAKRTRRPIRIRAHPGPQGAVAPVSLRDDLANAHCAVTWGSSAALQALAMGVPVFHGFPDWIGRDAARLIWHDIEEPFRGDRLPTFARVATAMWSREEIASGRAFRALLDIPC